MSFPAEPGKILRVALHRVRRAAVGIELLARTARRRLSGKRVLELAAGPWSRRRTGPVLTWQEHPVVREHVNARVSGDPGVNWLEHFSRGPGRELDLALNLGCGFGDLEAHAFSLGLVKRFHSLDLSEAALEAARERLSGRPVEFLLMDANRMELEPGRYDAVFAASSLHHFTRLEHVLDQVKLGLKPGGWLVFDEYVGPSRFQWSEDQLDVINQVLASLPPRLKRDLRRGFGVKRRVFRPPLDESSRDSPFEAARSAEILSLVEQRLEIARRRDYGGAVLHQLLDGIAGNFGPDRREDVELLRRIASMETELEKSGRIRSDFTAVAARKGGR